MCAPNWTSGLALSRSELDAAGGDAVVASKTALMSLVSAVIGVDVFIVSGSDVAYSLADEPVPFTTTNWMGDDARDAHI